MNNPVSSKLIAELSGNTPIIPQEQPVQKVVEQVQPKQFKSKHQHSMSRHHQELNDKILKVSSSNKQFILENGQSQRMKIDANTSMLINVQCDTELKESYKIFPSIVSDDKDLGGLGIYLSEYKQGDKSFLVVVQNDSDERNFFINFEIQE